jgi:hypothetical protein
MKFAILVLAFLCGASGLQNNISRKKIRSNEKYLFVQRKVSMII